MASKPLRLGFQNPNQANLDELALVLGCKVGVLPTTYLGLPFGAPFNSLVVWARVEERLHKRLTLWKR